MCRLRKTRRSTFSDMGCRYRVVRSQDMDALPLDGRSMRMPLRRVALYTCSWIGTGKARFLGVPRCGKMSGTHQLKMPCSCRVGPGFCQLVVHFLQSRTCDGKSTVRTLNKGQRRTAVQVSFDTSLKFASRSKSLVIRYLKVITEKGP